MRTLLAVTALSLLLPVSNVEGVTPAHLWSHRLGNTLSDYATAVTADGSGNVFVVGYFSGTVNLGGGDLVSAGNSDIVVARFTSAGVHLWSRRYGGPGADLGTEVAVDASGNVIVAGRFSNTVDFGGGGLVSAGGYDIFVAKYDLAGNHQWSKAFGDVSSDVAEGLAVDGSDNVLLTGNFDGSVNFGGGTLNSSGGGGNSDIFLVKFNSAGAHQWSRAYGAGAGDYGMNVAADAAGNVFLLGSFGGTVDFGSGTGLVSAGGSDIVLAKYSSAGAHQWSQSFGTTSSELPNGLAVDPAGNVIMSGSFLGTVDFGGGNRTSAGIFDIFIAKYRTSGVHVWSQSLGGTSNEFASAVATDAGGDVLIAGAFSGTADFGGGNMVSTGGTDIVIARYDSTGAHRWSRGFGGALSDNAYSIAVDAGGGVLASGYFQDVVDFGGGVLGSAGAEDMFVVKFSPGSTDPVITSIADIGNDQGRKVKIRFSRSGVDDVDAALPVTKYVAFRRDDPAPASAPLFLAPESPQDVSPLAAGWTEVGSVSAFADSSYGIDVPTIGDSTIAAGQYYSVFYIRAATDVPGTFYDSLPDSGYSLDNLAPGAPGGLSLNAGVLSWNGSTATDFDYFTVYGNNAYDFGTATVIDHAAVPSLDVTASPYSFYYVTATDFSGNEGQPATLATTGVSELPRPHVLALSTYPNPFSARTTVRYTVPGGGHVKVTVHDSRGRLIATLVDTPNHPAGSYGVDWTGRSEGGSPFPAGIYFARIEHDAGTRSRKMILMK